MSADPQLDECIADDSISDRSKKSVLYPSDYGKMTYGEIKRLAGSKPPNLNARQMKKLIAENTRLHEEARRPRR